MTDKKTVPVGHTSVADKTATLEVGAEAPDFQLPSHLGGTVKLSQYRGAKNVVLVTYPAAFTPV